MKQLHIAHLSLALCAACATTRPVPDHRETAPTSEGVALKSGGPKQLPQAISPKEFPKVPNPDPAAIEVPPGYSVEVLVKDLVYPTSIEMDDEGALYVAEAGYAYGDLAAPARIHRILPSGAIELVADQLNGPVNDLLWHGGKLYVSHRGKISVVDGSLTLSDLVTGLPSFGDHHNNTLVAGADGKIYFGQGVATNSGVVGLDNVYPFLWLNFYPDVHDIPARDLELAGQTYTSPDPITVLANTGELVRFGQSAKHLVSRKEPLLVETGAFQPFGKAAPKVPGQVKSNGTVLRMNPDGSELEVFAWGLRNPFGLGFAPDGTLYATDLGYDERGARPIANAPDVIWAVKQGGFYGFPDFAGGVPVTDPRFKSARGESPEPLLKNPPPVEKPTLLRPPHASPAKFDFSRSTKFGHVGEMFVAEVGWAGPATGVGAESEKQVARIDLASGTVTPFLKLSASRRGPQECEHACSAGLRMPIEAKFSRSGDELFVVDFGALIPIPAASGPAVRPVPGTGLIWRVTRAGAKPAVPPANLSILAAKRL